MASPDDFSLSKDKTRTDSTYPSHNGAGTPPWVRLLSVPTAILGILAFFLPWVEVSCGPVRLSVTGYEMATGSYSKKLSGQNMPSFWDKPGMPAMRPNERAGMVKAPRGELSQGPPARTPMLWLIPATCAALLILAVFGLPRYATLAFSLIGIAYLAYFGIVNEQQASDPRNTGGILELHWLSGFWCSWIGLLTPPVVAFLKPRETRT